MPRDRGDCLCIHAAAEAGNPSISVLFGTAQQGGHVGALSFHQPSGACSGTGAAIALTRSTVHLDVSIESFKQRVWVLQFFQTCGVWKKEVVYLSDDDEEPEDGDDTPASGLRERGDSLGIEEVCTLIAHVHVCLYMYRLPLHVSLEACSCI